jgi:Domain of unknown function (DUF4150)/GHH signature containing HNH/Endo VII superfamily nuclease toxin  2
VLVPPSFLERVSDMTVFANSMEISSKAMGGKSICQFPDVCFTPPLTPATPPGVPVPYPNTGMASDTSDGSTSVKIGGEQIMLKDKSAFKQSTGDEAGSAPKKGMINSKIKGKVYFVAWSMDVKVEGENVVRNLDMTTHNHACSPANGAVPMVHVAATAMGTNFDKCAVDAQKIKDNCKDDDSGQCPGALAAPVEIGQKDWVRAEKGAGKSLPIGVEAAMADHRASARFNKDESATRNAARMATHDADGNKCVQAMRCMLRPYSPSKEKGGCCPGQTPHHVPPQSYVNHLKSFNEGTALCVCLEGMNQHVGSHGENHALIDHFSQTLDLKDENGKSKGTLVDQKPKKLADAITVSAKATAEQCDCDEECIAAQLKDNFENEQNLPPEKTNVNYDQLASDDAVQKVAADYGAASADSVM